MTEQKDTVFLVDDDDAVRKALSKGLTKRGFQVEAFESAQSFLESYSSDRHGCLVLDLSMPEIDGFELQQKLNDSDILIPIIFITGHGSSKQSVKALKSGAVDFLMKPFTPEVLSDRINSAFKSGLLRRQINMEAGKKSNR